jgi:nitrite reductase (NADH) large subunit
MVRACTKASASCGSCTGLVSLLAITLGGWATCTTPMCKCQLHHEEIRRGDRRGCAETIPQVMQAKS